MDIKFFNTSSKKKEIFKPISQKEIKLYTCGPTVYDYAHLGNLRSYIFEDILKRVLVFNGYKIKHVMNITDVGHLTSDSDEGEDKIEAKAKKENLSAENITSKYTSQFLEDLKKLNILEPDVLAKATNHIKEQIEFIKKLEKKGLTYKTNDGIYFDTSKFPRYAEFANIDIEGLKAGARVKKLSGKKNITDFALWKFSPKDMKRQQEWKSPWGIGFPGWHLECSAMSMKYLGDQLDIHCGGIEHIPIHHTNEIAQSESLTGKKFVNFWMHNEHLLFEGHKMSKSTGNYATLQDLIDKNINPLAYRHLLLTAHYRSKLNFTWKSLEASQHFLNNFYHTLKNLDKPSIPDKNYLNMFIKAINNDLDTPKALAISQDLIKSNLKSNIISATLIEYDKIFGLGVEDIIDNLNDIPTTVKKLFEARELARNNNNFQESDRIRAELKKLGFDVKDTLNGQKLSRR